MKRKLALFLCFIFIIGCSSIRTPKISSFHVIPKKTLKGKTGKREKEIIKKIGKTKKEQTIEVFSKPGKGTDLVIYKKPIIQKGKKYRLSVYYDTIPIYDLIVNIFKNVLKKNFLIKANLSTTISISIDGNFTETEILEMLNFILENIGCIITQKGNLYVVENTSISQNAFLLKGTKLWFYKPKFLSIRDIYQIIMNLKSRSGKVLVLKNYIFTIDTKETLNSIRTLVKLIDTDTFKSHSIKIFKLQNTEPKDMQNEISQILKSTDVSPENFSLIPIDRLGFLVVIANTNELMNEIASLIKTLDSQPEKGERGIYIYRVQYVKVDKLAQTLEKLLSGKEAIVSKKKGKEQTPTPIISSKIVIVPDEVNNALIIEATPEDYKKIKAIISELDTMPRQVLIEVLIAEITLRNQMENGVEWWLKIHAKSYTSETASQFGLAGGRESLFGFTYYGINPDHFWNFLYFLSTKSKINILSSPHILVRDNEEATIDVGQEVPVLTMETVGTTQIQGTTAIDRRVEYRDVGVILKVKPHISEEGFITLEITQETSEAEKNTVSGIDSPVILKRKVLTTLMVQNEHSVILGGIINRKINNVAKKVPVIGDIPFLGKLFSYESKEEERTELIIMITPHVIKSVKEADIISNLFEERLKNLMKNKKK